MVDEKFDPKGKYTVFLLGKESYGICVLQTREIIGAKGSDITPLPRIGGSAQDDAYFRGVIYLRDKPFGVIDLKTAFDMGSTDIDEKTCIIIVEVQNPDQTTSQVGFLVDHVDAIVDFLTEEIQPRSASQEAPEHVIGFAKKKLVTILLDINRMMANIQKSDSFLEEIV